MSALWLSVPPLRRPRGPAIAGHALLAALATLAGAAVLVLQAQAIRIDRDSRAITIAISDPDPGRQGQRAAAVTAMLERRGDLIDIVPRDARDAASELAPWLGEGEAAPAMIDATLAPGGDDHPLRRALAGQPGIVVVDNGAGFDPWLRLIGELEGIALAIVLLALASVAPIGAITTMARMREHRDTLALLERLGATPAQIVRLLRQPVRSEALAGGLCGLGIGLAAILFIAVKLTKGDDGLVTSARIAPSAWLILAVIPPACVAVAMAAGEATARWMAGRGR